MGFEHGQNHGKARIVPSDKRAPRRAGRAWRDKRLNLDKQRPRSLHPGKDRGAWRPALPRGQKQFRRVCNLIKPAPGHFKNADLVGWAEAVFDRTQDTKTAPALTLK